MMAPSLFEDTPMTKYQNILETIGSTPIVKINRLAPKHVNLYVKVESFNPGGSVKDRLAYAIINDAERRGLLKPAATVQHSGFLMGAIAAPLLIGSRMQATGILPDIIAADFAPAVMSDAAIAERIDWALTALFI